MLNVFSYYVMENYLPTIVNYKLKFRYMKKLKTFATILFAVAFIAFFSSCDDDDDGEEQVIEITQAQLDAANKAIQMDLTGGSFEHGGPVAGGENTFRDIFWFKCKLTVKYSSWYYYYEKNLDG